jgi:hypothetical protein
MPETRIVAANRLWRPSSALTIAGGHGDRRVGDLVARLTHEGCGGKPKLVELITGIPGLSAWQRRIVLVSPSD